MANGKKVNTIITLVNHYITNINFLLAREKSSNPFVADLQRRRLVRELCSFGECMTFLRDPFYGKWIVSDDDYININDSKKSFCITAGQALSQYQTVDDETRKVLSNLFRIMISDDSQKKYLARYFYTLRSKLLHIYPYEHLNNNEYWLSHTENIYKGFNTILYQELKSILKEHLNTELNSTYKPMDWESKKYGVNTDLSQKLNAIIKEITALQETFENIGIKIEGNLSDQLVSLENRKDFLEDILSALKNYLENTSTMIRDFHEILKVKNWIDDEQQEFYQKLHVFYLDLKSKLSIREKTFLLEYTNRRKAIAHNELEEFDFTQSNEDIIKLKALKEKFFYPLTCELVNICKKETLKTVNSISSDVKSLLSEIEPKKRDEISDITVSSKLSKTIINRRKGLNLNPDIFVLPSDLILGEAIDDGGCFFDSLAQILNACDGSVNYTEKSLRIQCHQFYLNNKSLVDEWNNSDYVDGGKDDYSFIQYTAPELEPFSNKSPIWGRPHIEGRILCKQLPLTSMCIIEIIPDPSSDRLTYGYRLINSDGSSVLSENNIQQIISNEQIPKLVITQGDLHFVPVLPKTYGQQNSYTASSSINTTTLPEKVNYYLLSFTLNEIYFVDYDDNTMKVSYGVSYNTGLPFGTIVQQVYDHEYLWTKRCFREWQEWQNTHTSDTYKQLTTEEQWQLIQSSYIAQGYSEQLCLPRKHIWQYFESWQKYKNNADKTIDDQALWQDFCKTYFFTDSNTSKSSRSDAIATQEVTLTTETIKNVLPIENLKTFAENQQNKEPEHLHKKLRRSSSREDSGDEKVAEQGYTYSMNKPK